MRKNYQYIPVAQELVEPNDEVFFFRRHVTSLDIRSQIIQPPQSAALTTSFKACNQPTNPSTSVQFFFLKTFFFISLIHFLFNIFITVTCFFWNATPLSFTMDLDILYKKLIFNGRPSSFIHSLLTTARTSPHFHHPLLSLQLHPLQFL